MDEGKEDTGLKHLKRQVNHHKHRRASWHNYNQPGTYLITIVVVGRRPLLGSLDKDKGPRILLSELGNRIRGQELAKISAVYPMVHVWLCCIMPDHIHLIVNVSGALPAGRTLGHVIGAFKGGCSRVWWEHSGLAKDGDRNPLFEEGYNDGILLDDGQLDKWKRYINDNPRRLSLKRKNPELFKIWQNIQIGKWNCQMIGNMFLLDVPDICAVIVHRVDSEDEYRHKFDKWMACGERGGVLVSAAIAKREQLVMREAMNRGYRLIVLRENGFHKYYKPGGESFDACAEGLMLQICPWDYHFDTRVIKRAQCLELNSLALHISHGN